MNTDFFKRNAKALVAALAVVAAYMLSVVTGDETLSDVTTSEWIGLLFAVAGGYGVTWAIPNKTDEPADDYEPEHRADVDAL